MIKIQSMDVLPETVLFLMVSNARRDYRQVVESVSQSVRDGRVTIGTTSGLRVTVPADHWLTVTD
jgi:hypothetical protein